MHYCFAGKRVGTWPIFTLKPRVTSKLIPAEYAMQTNLPSAYKFNKRILGNFWFSILLGQVDIPLTGALIWEQFPSQAQPHRSFASHKYYVKWVHGLWVHAVPKAHVKDQPEFSPKMRKCPTSQVLQSLTMAVERVCKSCSKGRNLTSYANSYFALVSMTKATDV